MRPRRPRRPPRPPTPHSRQHRQNHQDHPPTRTRPHRTSIHHQMPDHARPCPTMPAARERKGGGGQATTWVRVTAQCKALGRRVGLRHWSRHLIESGRCRAQERTWLRAGSRMLRRGEETVEILASPSPWPRLADPQRIHAPTPQPPSARLRPY